MNPRRTTFKSTEISAPKTRQLRRPLGECEESSNPHPRPHPMPLAISLGTLTVDLKSSCSQAPGKNSRVFREVPEKPGEDFDSNLKAQCPKPYPEILSRILALLVLHT